MRDTERKMQPTPRSRGPLSAFVLEKLSGPPGGPWSPPTVEDDDSEDAHLALYLCYELHYLGVQGADRRWEWDPGLLSFRQALEERFEQELKALVRIEPTLPIDVEERLNELVGRKPPRSLSQYMAREATFEQFREFVAHRSLYHLKEADPHTWAIPRLFGKPKAALIEIQADEYGGGQEQWMHSTLYRKLMQAMGLDILYGSYVDAVPAVTLATINLMSMFGLNSRWRGALVGHLALFEMTSSGPNGLYGQGLRRLGFDGEAALFYDEHVEADSLHEAIAAHDLAGGLALQQPSLATDIVFGAECLAALDEQVADHMLSCWTAGRSSLRSPLEPGQATPGSVPAKA